jgi:DNA topoisomerase-1
MNLAGLRGDQLVFVASEELEITRNLISGKWAYYDARGSQIRDRDEIDRLNSIALPLRRAP